MDGFRGFSAYFMMPARRRRINTVCSLIRKPGRPFGGTWLLPYHIRQLFTIVIAPPENFNAGARSWAVKGHPLSLIKRDKFLILNGPLSTMQTCQTTDKSNFQVCGCLSIKLVASCKIMDCAKRNLARKTISTLTTINGVALAPLKTFLVRT